MTYQDDPNLSRRSYPPKDDTSYAGWIIGGIVALVVILGIFFLAGRPNDNTAANAPGANTPTTTGSATPAPPQQNAPASTTTPGNAPTQNR